MREDEVQCKCLPLPEWRTIVLRGAEREEGIFAGRPAPSMHFLEGSNGREGKSVHRVCKDQSSKLLQDRSGHSKALAQLLNAGADTARHRPGLLGAALLRCVLLLVPSDSDSTICIFFRCSLHFVLGTFGIAWYYCLRVCYLGSLGRAHMKVSTMYTCSICLLVAYLECCVLLERWSLPQCCSSWRPLARALRT